MCQRDLPRFLTFHHTIEAGGDNPPLEYWMTYNIPADYRVCGVVMDKIVSDVVFHAYTIFAELRDHDHG